MERLTIAEAAEIMGVSQQRLRIGLQRGIYPFGVAQPSIWGKRKTFMYTIYPNKFAEFYPYTPAGSTEKRESQQKVKIVDEKE